MSFKPTLLVALALVAAACSKSATAPTFPSFAGVYKGSYATAGGSHAITATIQDRDTAWYAVLDDQIRDNNGNITGSDYNSGYGTLTGTTFTFDVNPSLPLSSFSGTVTSGFAKLQARIAGNNVTLAHQK